MTIGKRLRRAGSAEIKKIKFGKKRKPLPKAPRASPPSAPPKTKRRFDVLERAKRESKKRKPPIGIRPI